MLGVVIVPRASSAVISIQRTGADYYDLLVGDTQQMGYTVTSDATTSSYLTWTTDNSSVAAVDTNGVVTANAAGTAVITAAADGATCTWTIYVDSESSAEVLSENPENGDEDVPVDKTITFEFSRDMRESTINEDNIYLRESGSSDNIDAYVSYDSDTYEVTIEPRYDLDYDTEYYVYVSSDVEDINNERITSERWHFTTENSSNYRDVISSSSPSDGDYDVPVDKTIRIYFDTDMRESTINEDNVYLRESGSSHDIPATVDYSSESRRATLTPDELLKPDSRYIVYLSNNIKVDNGDYIDSQDFGFTTEREGSALTVPAETPAAAFSQTSSDNNVIFGTPINPAVKLNGKFISFTGTKPYIKNSRTFLPFRTIFELLGASSYWDAPTKTIMGVLNNNAIVLQIGNKTAYKNLAPIKMEIAPEIVAGETMVPLRIAAEGVNATVVWEQSTNTVIITQ